MEILELAREKKKIKYHLYTESWAKGFRNYKSMKKKGRDEVNSVKINSDHQCLRRYNILVATCVEFNSVAMHVGFVQHILILQTFRNNKSRTIV